jgi:hypothetical protein
MKSEYTINGWSEEFQKYTNIVFETYNKTSVTIKVYNEKNEIIQSVTVDTSDLKELGNRL